MIALRCRVWAHKFGEWDVELVGYGYPTAIIVNDARLETLVLRDGYVLEDPAHLVDLYGPPNLREEYNNTAALDADSAGYGYRSGGPDTGDYGLSLEEDSDE